jgi:hypothetical protein
VLACRHQSSTTSVAVARFAAVQSAPAAMSWLAPKEVVSPKQREPAALAAATPETASSITRQEAGCRPSRRAASRKMSGELCAHYRRAAELGPQG